MPSQTLIAFEGPIGAGKTTLARIIGNELRAAVLLEEFENNEYLADFYSDRPRYSVQMQLTFLLSRWRQLRNFKSDASIVVADYTLAKDRLFAELLLRDRDLRLYTKAREAIEFQVQAVSLTVFLDAPTEVLTDRIQKRGRPYEQDVPSAYLDDLRQAYGAYKRSLPARSVWDLDTSKLELGDAVALRSLAQSILAAARENVD